MNKELIVNSTGKSVEIALVEDKKLVELHQENSNTEFSVGDIFLGQTKKIVPGLNAAFVDIGYKKDAFLHYTDLGPSIKTLIKLTRNAINGHNPDQLISGLKPEPKIVKTGNVSEVFRKKETVLVQILKEPISTKGPRIGCELALAGRNVVLTPFSNSIAISRKITSLQERKRLERLVKSIMPNNEAVIIRTAAEGKTASVLHTELTQQVDIWKNIINQLKGNNKPRKIFSEADRTTTILRDLLNDSFNKIIINNKEIFTETKSFITKIAPGKEKIVSHYSSNKPIFDEFDITKQIKASFGKTVNLQKGGYLVIEHTEALHVIDINSGQKFGSSDDQESGAYAVNIEAAIEIARQLRLRDIGGIIIIDFIDIRNPAKKKAIFNKMKEVMKNDRAKHTILPLSKFSLMQITRQRVREQINKSTSEVCPTCSGTGKIGASILIIDEIEKKIAYLINELGKPKIKLYVHPFIKAYLTSGLFSKQVRWLIKYYSKVNIFTNSSYHLTEYRFFDKNDDEIVLP